MNGALQPSYILFFLYEPFYYPQIKEYAKIMLTLRTRIVHFTIQTVINVNNEL